MGESLVGKTAIVRTFVQDKAHNGISLVTTGIDTINKNIEINEKKILLKLIDGCWCQHARSIICQYIPGAQALILIYDITSKRSFDDLKEWLNRIKQYEHDKNKRI